MAADNFRDRLSSLSSDGYKARPQGPSADERKRMKASAAWLNTHLPQLPEGYSDGFVEAQGAYIYAIHILMAHHGSYFVGDVIAMADLMLRRADIRYEGESQEDSTEDAE